MVVETPANCTICQQRYVVNSTPFTTKKQHMNHRFFDTLHKSFGLDVYKRVGWSHRKGDIEYQHTNGRDIKPHELVRWLIWWTLTRPFVQLANFIRLPITTDPMLPNLLYNHFTKCLITSPSWYCSLIHASLDLLLITQGPTMDLSIISLKVHKTTALL